MQKFKKNTSVSNVRHSHQDNIRISGQPSHNVSTYSWRQKKLIGLIAITTCLSVLFAIYVLNKASIRVSDSELLVAPSKSSSNATWHKSNDERVKLPRDLVATHFSSNPPTYKNLIGPVYEEKLPQNLNEMAPVIRGNLGHYTSIHDYYLEPPEEIEKDLKEGTKNNDFILSNPHMKFSKPFTKNISIKQQSEKHTKSEDANPLDQKLWIKNAVAVPNLPANKPMIAIVIDDMGLDRKRSPRAIALPGPITLAFLTYAQDLQEQTTKARQAGHELMVHVPMEPQSSTIDPGPNVLKVEDRREQVLEKLDWGLSKFNGYVGINNHMGSKFTKHQRGMSIVLNEVKKRGLLFLDSLTASGSTGSRLAAKLEVPFGTRNVFLDHINNEHEVRMRLTQTERLARKNGAAIAIGHPHDNTLKVLEEWLPTLEDRGFILVPVSTIIKSLWITD